jgi:hypothetical protein
MEKTDFAFQSENTKREVFLLFQEGYQRKNTIKSLIMPKSLVFIMAGPRSTSLYLKKRTFLYPILKMKKFLSIMKMKTERIRRFLQELCPLLVKVN